MDTIQWTTELRFLIAFGLGFLVGLERESARTPQSGHAVSGVRTYTIVSLLGFGCAWLHTLGVTFALLVGCVSVTVFAAIGYIGKQKEGHLGYTSEVALLLTFFVGALSLLTIIIVPMALGIVNTILLSEKSDVEKFVERLDKSEFLAVLKFLLVTVIILPVLPNEDFTEFKLNPTRIWQIVIMVSSIGFVGYFLIKKFGSEYGLTLSGLLGGIVSSTAVSIAVGRIAQKQPDQSRNALQASLLASAVMYLRILVLIWILDASLVQIIWWKFCILSAVGFVLAFLVRSENGKKGHDTASALQNPFEIKPALLFALVFVVLSILTTFVSRGFGSSGILALSGLVGVTDIDPFILSLVQGQMQSHQVVFIAIIVAMMSNTLVKGAYFITLAKEVRKETIFRYGMWALFHIPILLL